MSRRERRLGRGLASLIPYLPLSPGSQVIEVDINAIRMNPSQPRQHVDEEELADLAESIRAHGILQPLLARREGERYQLIVGGRRFQAARLAGLRRVPIILREADPQESLEMALVENIQRSNLNPLEEAVAYQNLIQDFGLTQEEVARQVGKSRPTIANSLRLLSLTPECKRALWEGRITAGHARALLRLEDRRQQLQALAEVQTRGLSVRHTEELARQLVTPPPEPVESRGRVADDLLALARHIEAELAEALVTEVTVAISRHGRGRVSIAFRSQEELEDLQRRLLGAAKRS
jgi:ParB family chromosome partitioning protein